MDNFDPATREAAEALWGRLVDYLREEGEAMEAEHGRTVAVNATISALSGAISAVAVMFLEQGADPYITELVRRQLAVARAEEAEPAGAA